MNKTKQPPTREQDQQRKRKLRRAISTAIALGAIGVMWAINVYAPEHMQSIGFPVATMAAALVVILG